MWLLISLPTVVFNSSVQTLKGVLYVLQGFLKQKRQDMVSTAWKCKPATWESMCFDYLEAIERNYE